MKFKKLTYGGPATSLTVAGLNFLRGKAIHLTDGELPKSVRELRKLGLEVVDIEAAARPENATDSPASYIRGQVGIMYVGGTHRRMTAWGPFLRNVPRFDIPVEAVVALEKDSDYKKVER